MHYHYVSVLSMNDVYPSLKNASGKQLKNSRLLEHYYIKEEGNFKATCLDLIVAFGYIPNDTIALK